MARRHRRKKGWYEKHRPPADAPLTEVRCLGPGPEHRFPSADPARERVCPKCRLALSQLNPSLRDGFQPGLSFD